MAEQEGVVKYTLNFSQRAIENSVSIDLLEHWRQKLMQPGLVGQDDNRYDGYGFGNISQRVDASRFIISGTQTGHFETLERRHYAVVTDFDKQKNTLEAYGEWKPSSEALSHAAIYQANPAIAAVFHVHSPAIWGNYQQLDTRTTAASVPYGTPAMADALQAAINGDNGSIVMLGHEDGVVAYGLSCDQAGQVLLSLLESAGGHGT